ncbi:MAG: phage major capsid protein [Prevotella sp.]|jgi:HK97 family phage major capsid protein
MEKSRINVRELIDKFQQNCDRITEIADVCEREKRERNESETTEFEAIMRENQLLQMKMQAAAAEHLRENPNAPDDAIKIIRENAANGRKSEIIFVRDIMMVGDVAKGSIVPLNVQDILKPLQEGFILDKVGLPMPTGLAGDFVWPMYEMVSAQIAGETVALSDTKIPFSKMTANPERIGIAIPVSNQSLNQSQGILETIVREVMPMSIRLLLNKILFSTEKVNGATNLVGPFVGLVDKATTLSAVPTFKELNQMKAAVLETGIDGSHLCWIMTKSMQAILEGTPINEKGIFKAMLENGTLCGLPVYTTNEIRSKGKTGTVTEFIGLGDWRYQPMGLFGSIRFIVDPYSKARQDCVDFVLNCDYGTKTLRKEAFSLGKVAPSV